MTRVVEFRHKKAVLPLLTVYPHSSRPPISLADQSLRVRQLRFVERPRGTRDLPVHLKADDPTLFSAHVFEIAPIHYVVSMLSSFVLRLLPLFRLHFHKHRALRKLIVSNATRSAEHARQLLARHDRVSARKTTEPVSSAIAIRPIRNSADPNLI